MSAPLSNIRLPDPPDQYNQGHMARLVNTLEILQKTNYFAVSLGIESAIDQAEASAWFVA